jgi:molybdopterin-guanine dinucleotide biosynthesis protein A
MTAVPSRDAIAGVVLAGGLGRRMSGDGRGEDKGLRAFAGQPLAALAINANRNLEAWRSYGLPVIPDRLAGFAGPLAGLHAAMTWADTPWIATVPCDSPMLPVDLVARLAQAVAAADAQVAVARTGSRAHPVFALVQRALAADLERFLASGRRRIDAWYAPLRVAEVLFEDERAFVNINTPDDLRRLEADAASPSAPTSDP